MVLHPFHCFFSTSYLSSVNSRTLGLGHSLVLYSYPSFQAALFILRVRDVFLRVLHFTLFSFRSMSAIRFLIRVALYGWLSFISPESAFLSGPCLFSSDTGKQLKISFKFTFKRCRGRFSVIRIGKWYVRYWRSHNANIYLGSAWGEEGFLLTIMYLWRLR